MMKHVLSIAGTDPSGGAGAAADCKTFCAHGCFALNVITAVVSQNTQGVRGYMDVTPELIASQIDAVFEDIDVDAVKIGMVSVPETIRVIADKLKQYQPPYVVIDPVMVATSGHRLLVPEAEQTLKEVLLPLADVLTPNLPEAEVLTVEDVFDSEGCLIEENLVTQGDVEVEDGAIFIYSESPRQAFSGEGYSDMECRDRGTDYSCRIISENGFRDLKITEEPFMNHDGNPETVKRIIWKAADISQTGKIACRFRIEPAR